MLLKKNIQSKRTPRNNNYAGRNAKLNKRCILKRKIENKRGWKREFENWCRSFHI